MACQNMLEYLFSTLYPIKAMIMIYTYYFEASFIFQRLKYYKKLWRRKIIYGRHFISWCANSSSNTIKIKINKYIYIFLIRRHVSHVRYHLSGATCHMSCISCHMLLTPTATATDPLPANSTSKHSMILLMILTWSKK